MSRIFVGQTNDGMNLTMPNEIRCGHVQIVGATGRGKTESVIIPWLTQDIVQDHPAILIDGKGDWSIYERMKSVYEQNGLDLNSLIYFDIGSFESSFTTNPIKYGSAQQITDRIFSTFDFDNSYFKATSYEACLLVIQVLSKSFKEGVTFKKIYLALTDDKFFSEAIAKLDENEIELKRLATRYLAQSYNDRQEKVAGFTSQLQPLAVGELSALVNGQVDGKGFFTITECLCASVNQDNQKFTTALIFIPTLLYQKTGSRLGQMFLQELSWAVALKEREVNRKFHSVFLDEFSSFVYEGFINLLNKARSSQTAIHLSHQSLGDLEAVSPEFAQAVHTNTNVKCVLGVNDPQTSDFFAKHFGTQESEKTTERVKKSKFFGGMEHTGEMSLRATEEYVINPNRLRHYSRGEGVLSFIYDGKPVTEEIQFARSPY